MFIVHTCGNNILTLTALIVYEISSTSRPDSFKKWLSCKNLGTCTSIYPL